ncbi:hypothetical protein MLD38_038152 [Melastoma candidum]|uniref:Uncharacterized protein n=1 Tax=Melastoma candidum TaxID=119954 RepID=A0ACB9KYM9_9MYRT|nr:hypothetical protein MLD38_038152 [Melastoma candidum]
MLPRLLRHDTGVNSWEKLPGFILQRVAFQESSICHTYLDSNVSVAPPCARAPSCCSFRTSGSLTAYSIRARRDGCLVYLSFFNLGWEQALEPVVKPRNGDPVGIANKPPSVRPRKTDRNSTSAIDLVKDSPGAKRCYCNAGLTWNGVKGVCINREQGTLRGKRYTRQQATSPGIGGFGEVHKGILDEGTPVAIKCAKLGNAKGTNQVLYEVRTLCKLTIATS